MELIEVLQALQSGDDIDDPNYWVLEIDVQRWNLWINKKDMEMHILAGPCESDFSIKIDSIDKLQTVVTLFFGEGYNVRQLAIDRTR